MLWIDAHSAEGYLRQTGRVAASEAIDVHELSGGVSNMVLAIDFPCQPERAFVLKQARAQLRTREPWFSSVERIWREADVLAICERLLTRSPDTTADVGGLTASAPRILFEDRANYLFAMAAAPRPNLVWKQELLAGRAEPRVAVACGRLLARLHGESWLDADIANRLGDATLFDQLRVDPYYRALAAAHPEMRDALEHLIGSLKAHPRSLVHADFSPKNLLVFSGGLMMVDFETGHYGDPAFDLGFFLSHLVLKACHKAPVHDPYLALSEVFHLAYSEVLAPRIGSDELAALWARGIQHFAGCAWARLDGKSPVEYLNDQRRRDQLRELCRKILLAPPETWPDVVQRCKHLLAN